MRTIDAPTQGFDRKPIKNVMPAVRVDGQEFIMLAPQLAGIAVSDLGVPVASPASIEAR